MPSDVKLALRAAMEAGDRTAAVAAFAENAVLFSPFTEKLQFEGRAQIAVIVGVVLDAFENLRYTDEVRAGDQAFLVARARIGGQEVEMVDHLELDDAGLVTRMTVFFRPLPAAAVALRVIGAGLGKHTSPTRGAVIGALARPLGLITRAADGVGVKLIGPIA